MKVVFLAGAEEDLKELRHYVVRSFGKQAWLETFQRIKDSVRALQDYPLSGPIPDELVDLGLRQYRQVVSSMNRIIYEITEEVIYIHIVCDTRRDMRTLLSRRLLRMVP
ncbi:type II toxin-antitoxin system RelE/ParE family toxin [Cupriavidus sp. BIS7]|uniref:type II toxin-antitoxin system RelE/ParE family toxin n=1 Tax=Cupriavidus sp. BIS7 TaxID=1217718 RepID=UPI0003084DEF|nr:type II toxin-antitoxin system RelE/ParE family toxin [Cupriavidus sp. BIS7]